MVFQGTAMRCQKYFERLGCPLAPFKNPADSFMKLLSISYPKTEEETEKIESFVIAYMTMNQPRVLQERREISFDDLTEAIERHQTVKVSLCKQFWSLLGRNYIGLVRNPASLIGRIVISVFVAGS